MADTILTLLKLFTMLVNVKKNQTKFKEPVTENVHEKIIITN